MSADEWHDRWRNGRIGFHQQDVAHPLVKFWPTLNVADGSRVFVPLCGKSLDLLWLRNRGHDVIGVELSAIAVESFFMENGILARRKPRQGFDEYWAAHIRLLQGDLFGLIPQMLDPCAAVYDRAALIAMPAELRASYVDKLADLTAPGTSTLLITIEYPQNEMAGPPFSVDSLAVNRLYSAHHKVRELHRADILAADLKLGTRVSRLHEVCYHLIRR